MNILQINSSARRDASHSTRLATRLVERLRQTDPEAKLTVRDLNDVPVLDEAALTALFMPADQRTPEQAATRAQALLRDPVERARLSASVRARIVAGRHTYRDRLASMLNAAICRIQVPRH